MATDVTADHTTDRRGHGPDVIDWTTRSGENCGCLVKRILRKHGYSPTSEEKPPRRCWTAALLITDLWVAA